MKLKTCFTSLRNTLLPALTSRGRQHQTNSCSQTENLHFLSLSFVFDGGCTPPFLPADGASYLGCMRRDSTLRAWVDCLCLARKDWAGSGAVERSHRRCCCRAEACEIKGQSAVCNDAGHWQTHGLFSNLTTLVYCLCVSLCGCFLYQHCQITITYSSKYCHWLKSPDCCLLLANSPWFRVIKLLNDECATLQIAKLFFFKKKRRKKRGGCGIWLKLCKIICRKDKKIWLSRFSKSSENI